MVTQHPDGTVEFAHYRPGARRVTVAGDFNLWQTDHHDLRAGDDGWWRTRLVLPGGTHQFRYLVDGERWETDFAAFGIEGNGMGGHNSVLVIEPCTRSVARAA